MKNYIWDNELIGKGEFTITKVYKNTSKNGNEYFTFYIKDDDENIYCTKYKKFYFLRESKPFKAYVTAKASEDGKKIFADWNFVID